MSRKITVDGLPDPDRAYALLIGVGEFDDRSYRSLPSSNRSVEQLASMLSDADGDMWRLPAEPPGDRISVLGPRVTVGQARRALHAATHKENLDSLLVCISCHGRRYDDWHRTPGLHLAMSDSDSDIGGTHWHFEEISQELERAKHKIKHTLLIVDACYADGLEPPQGLSGGEPIDHLKVPGTVVLSATLNRVEAWPDWPGTDWTAFLGALIESIAEGVPGPQSILTARNIFMAAASRIADARARGLRAPEPSIRMAGRSEIPLCRNRSYVRPTRAVDDEQGEYASDFMTSVDCFEAIHQAHDRGRDASIARIIRTFAANKDSAVAEVAALVKDLSASEFSDYCEHAYSTVCTRRSPADIAEFVDGLHSCGAEVDAGAIVKGLEERDDAHAAAADLYAHLLNNDCQNCADEAEIVSALIVGDPKLSSGVLAIWR
jgi:hypothetical protein